MAPLSLSLSLSLYIYIYIIYIRFTSSVLLGALVSMELIDCMSLESHSGYNYVRSGSHYIFNT